MRLALLSALLVLSACHVPTPPIPPPPTPAYYVQLAWIASPDISAPATKLIGVSGMTNRKAPRATALTSGYHVWRAALTNGIAGQWALVGTSSTIAYEDTSVVPGNWAFEVSAFIGSVESPPSNVFQIEVK